jgi:ribonucleoside-diphosphate reductase alpha chain
LQNHLLILKGYLRDGESSWGDIARRVGKAIAKAEDEGDKRTNAETLFTKSIENLEFIPSTPCLINAGNEKQQLSSCFILDMTDDIESIYNAKSEMAKIFQKNGGAGLNISVLRPMNAPIETSGGMSCGALGFMEEFDLTADVITRKNLRKGALKIDLCDWHPDIVEFIKCKDNTARYTHMNISVAVSDRFMQAVECDADWKLEFPDYHWDKKVYNSSWRGDLDNWKEQGFPTKVYRVMKARELYHDIMEAAWRTGEPGVSFIDTMDRDNPNPKLGKVRSTNPCSEFASYSV